MRKQLSYLFALIISMFVFTGCENNNPAGIPVEKELVGVYKSELNILLGDIPIVTGLVQKINIDKAGENKIKLELKGFSMGGASLGDIAISSCTVVKAAEGYSFTGSETITLVEPIGQCEVTVKGTIIGSEIKGDIDVALTGGKVTVNFTGTKLTGNESSEAKITSFTFENSPAGINAPIIDDENGSITFTTVDGVDVDLNLTPKIVVSANATLTPANGVQQDFSQDVTYTVVAQDGTTKVYTVSMLGQSSLYSFDNWGSESDEGAEVIPLAKGWASCNLAVGLIKALGAYADPKIEYTGAYPVTSTTDAYKGTHAARLESVDTKGAMMMGTKVPKVTAGSLFLGTFNAMAALADPMTTTEFGVMYDKEPIMVRGFYKYTPGADFYTSEGINGTLDKTKKDACSITAVLYEVASETETLDGNTIYKSDKIYASAMFTTDKVVSEYTQFNLELEYTKTYDPTKLYKLAVIFSASKDGAAYNAAIGSVLIVDEVEVISK